MPQDKKGQYTDMENVKQMGLALMPENIDDLYVDQAMSYGGYFFSAYTPYGIKQIDSDFCHRIQNIGTDNTYTSRREEREYTKEDPEKLRNDILDNQHLHPCIIENLLQNLDRVLEEIKNG